MGSRISAVAYALPANIVDNVDLAELSSRWNEADILEKTGIATRHVASDTEYASDFATTAAQRLFEKGLVRPDEINFLFFVTQTPNYFLPTSACLIQERLGLPVTVAAFDINLGCSGFVYALAVAPSGLLLSMAV